MCGIAGKFNFDRNAAVDRSLVQRMTTALSHRGPDGEGIHISSSVGLGHRRLSIIDLDTGAQPMCNEDRTVWITFNGEIYNYRALRAELLQRGHQFRTHSDTEVIVHLWEEYGVECVRRLRGMFAFGIWDTRHETLFLARDRVGIKPLYYCETSQGITFASEIKALLQDSDVSRTISSEAVDRFLTYLYLPGQITMFRDVHKVDPGHYILASRSKVLRAQYWDLQFRESSTWTSLDAAGEDLRTLLHDTVRDHMISDVPVGFLASGGVDSTALLSFAAEHSSMPIETFTVGFSGKGVVDERPYARLASRFFGTGHHEITLSAAQFAAYLPAYVWHMEEPVCEPPAIALYSVSRLAATHVKVLISGEGGDEAFAGYPEYRGFPALEHLKQASWPLRPLAKAALNALSLFGQRGRVSKYRGAFELPLPEYYFSRVSSPDSGFNPDKGSLYTDAYSNSIDRSRSAAPTRDLLERHSSESALNRMLYVDSKTWLPDDLLLKADKMTMAASVELRVPFLDHLVLEWAASLPASYKVRGHESKRVLKRAVRSRIPAEILHRRKAGFPVPYGSWLMRDLRSWVHDILLHPRAIGRGYFQKRAVEALLQRTDPSAESTIFGALVLELWHQIFIDNSISFVPTPDSASGLTSFEPLTNQLASRT